MNVMIKGIEMPKSCNECFARQHIPADIDHYPFDYCVFENWQLSRTPLTLTGKELKSRPSYCPLVPVPPHGRLIDADALMTHEVLLPRDGGKMPIVYASYVRDAPTIIEAEDGE